MQHLVAAYGYVAVFLLMVAESACMPVPSELVMTFGGAVAAGAIPGTSLKLVGVIAAGVAGNVAGSYIAWAAGRYGGQPALRRWGRRFWLRDHDLDRANRWFARHGPRAVLISRLLPVVRTFISLPAGIAGMDPGRVPALPARSQHSTQRSISPLPRGLGRTFAAIRARRNVIPARRHCRAGRQRPGASRIR